MTQESRALATHAEDSVLIPGTNMGTETLYNSSFWNLIFSLAPVMQVMKIQI